MHFFDSNSVLKGDPNAEASLRPVAIGARLISSKRLARSIHEGKVGPFDMTVSHKENRASWAQLSVAIPAGRPSISHTVFFLAPPYG